MLVAVLLFGLLYVPSGASGFKGSSDSLKLVQIFHRHGERSPTTYKTFPTEDPRIGDKFPFEAAELTLTGIRQEYILGLNIRAQYEAFLGPSYHSQQLSYLAGKDNRTIASALAVLVGLFPPNKDQEWLPGFAWQPIPVHTIDLLDVVSFGAFDLCQVLGPKTEKTAVYNHMLDAVGKPILDWLTNVTGVDASNPRLFDKIVDSIKTRYGLKAYLPLPTWATPKVVEKAIEWNNRIHQILTDHLAPIVGSWHFDQLVGNMESAVRNFSQHKLVMYSGHDTNTLAIARFLNLSTIAATELQTFAHYLAIELHSGPNPNEHFVEFWLHPKLNGSRVFVDIPECPVPCLYSQFRLLRPRVSTAEFMVECHGVPATLDDRCTLYASLAGSLVIIIVILIAAVLSILWWCCHYRNKYNTLSVDLGDEEEPLLGRRSYNN
uniref:Acid phosphatase n=1 Tax=Panagrellus redivivus TaxID=6233 RepID=A0A7E4VHN6_PANRE